MAIQKLKGLSKLSLFACACLAFQGSAAVAVNPEGRKEGSSGGRKIALLMDRQNKSSNQDTDLIKDPGSGQKQGFCPEKARGASSSPVLEPVNRVARTFTTISTPAKLPEDLRNTLEDYTFAAERLTKTYFCQTAVLCAWLADLVSPGIGVPAISPFSAPKPAFGLRLNARACEDNRPQSASEQKPTRETLGH